MFHTPGRHPSVSPFPERPLSVSDFSLDGRSPQRNPAKGVTLEAKYRSWLGNRADPYGV